MHKFSEDFYTGMEFCDSPVLSDSEVSVVSFFGGRHFFWGSGFCKTFRLFFLLGFCYTFTILNEQKKSEFFPHIADNSHIE